MIPCRSGSSRLLAAGFGAALLTLMTGPFGAAAQMPEATGAEIEAARALYFRGEGATAHLAGGTIEADGMPPDVHGRLVPGGDVRRGRVVQGVDAAQ